MEQELKRLRRIITVLSVLVLVLMFGTIIWGSLEISRLKSVIAAIPSQETIQPRAGVDGYTPIKGVDYFDGKDGADSLSTRTIIEQPIYTNVSVGPTEEQVAQAITDYCTARENCVGEEGARGPIGRTIFLRLNTLLGVEQCRYAGDDSWLPIEECE